MNRNHLNLLVDAMSLVVSVALIGTGLIMRFLLPPGSGGYGRGRGMALWGLGRHDWGDVHFGLSVGLIALILLHIALHWRWVCNVTCRAIGRGKTGNSD